MANHVEEFICQIETVETVNLGIELTALCLFYLTSGANSKTEYRETGWSAGRPEYHPEDIHRPIGSCHLSLLNRIQSPSAPE